MSATNPSEMTDAELVDEYERWATAAAKAGDVEQYNRTVLGPLQDVYREIEKRGESVRRRLLPFLQHSDPRIRFLVAVDCYDLADRACARALRELAQGGSKYPGVSTIALVKLIDLDKELHARAVAGDEALISEILGRTS